MRLVKVQKIWQEAKVIGKTIDGKALLEDEASLIENGFPIGFNKEGDYLYPILSEEALREYDRNDINEFESVALRRANELDLFNPKTAQELERKALAGELDEPTQEKVRELQRALKADGKYDAPIDPIPGEKTRQGLASLVLENTPALIKDSEKLERDERWEEVTKQKEGRTH